MATPPDQDADDDETPEVSPGRRAFRIGMMCIYGGAAVGIPAYVFTGPKPTGYLDFLTWLISFYMAARGLATYVKYRQETRPPRYSRAYVEARDLFTQSDDNEHDPTKNGSDHG